MTCVVVKGTVDELLTRLTSHGQETQAASSSAINAKRFFRGQTLPGRDYGCGKLLRALIRRHVGVESLSTWRRYHNSLQKRITCGNRGSANGPRVFSEVATKQVAQLCVCNPVGADLGGGNIDSVFSHYYVAFSKFLGHATSSQVLQYATAIRRASKLRAIVAVRSQPHLSSLQITAEESQTELNDHAALRIASFR